MSDLEKVESPFAMLVRTARELVDAVVDRHDNHAQPLRYTVPWAKVAALRVALNIFDAAPPSEAREAQGADTTSQTPIPMILHCPACGMQHVDGQEITDTTSLISEVTWNNPPHRSHLCAGCGHIWRPADVPTTGVAAIQTKGKNDSPLPATIMSVRSAVRKEIREEIIQELIDNYDRLVRGRL